MEKKIERPILFSGEMVRAILEGRKTQTRRVVKPQIANLKHCPFEVNQILWVRETFTYVTLCKGGDPWTRGAKKDGTYREDPAGNPMMLVWRASNPYGAPIWAPSIFMPRWACRLVLEITDVRIERLRQITEKDAEAEGVSLVATIPAVPSNTPMTYKYGFENLWGRINGKTGPKSWKADPWVWAISFKKVTSA